MGNSTRLLYTKLHFKSFNSQIVVVSKNGLEAMYIEQTSQ